MADDKKEIKNKTQETAEIVEDAFRRITENIKNIFDEAIDGADDFAKSLEKDITRSLNQIAKSSSKLLIENQEKLSRGTLTRAQIDKQILNLNSKLKALEIEKNIAIKNGLVDEEKINKQYQHAVEYNKELVQELQEQLISATEIENIQRQITESLGVSGALMKGMSKIPFLGDLPGMKDAMKEIDEEAKKIYEETGHIVTKQEAYEMAVKKTGILIKNALTDPLTITVVTTKLLVSGFKAFWDIGMKADTEITNLSKSMAISTEQATEMRNRFKEIQDSGGNIFETTTNLVNAQLELANAFGTTVGFSEQMVKDQVLLTKQMGFTAEEAQGIQQLSMANGMSAKDITNSVIKQTSALAKQTGIQLDNKKVIGEVAKVSGQLRLQYQNNPSLIAAAVVQTQKLGISLEQAAKSSKSLLDFESSISNELEAELLTGKDLNLEKARLLALNGDVAGSSAEMLKQVGSAAEFSKMNVIQQEALAKAVGMNADELANSLIQQENLNKLGSESRKQIEEKAEMLRKNGQIDEANRLMNSIGNEKEAQDALAKISAQETFNASMDKMKAILSSIVDGPATSLVNLISNVVSFATKLAPIFKAIGIALIPVAALLTAMWIKTQAIAIMAAIQGAWQSLGPIPLVGAGLAAAAAIAGVGYIMSQPKPAGDIYSPADGKTQVSTKEGGLFELSKNDSLFAFPESKNKKGKPSGGGGETVDMSPVVNKLDQIYSVLTKIESKEGKVTADTNEIGKAANMATYKVFSK